MVDGLVYYKTHKLNIHELPSCEYHDDLPGNKMHFCKCIIGILSFACCLPCCQPAFKLFATVCGNSLTSRGMFTFHVNMEPIAMMLS